MPVDIATDVTLSYSRKQSRISELIDELLEIVRNVYKPQCSDEYALHFPWISKDDDVQATIKSWNDLIILRPSVDLMEHHLDDCSMAKILATKLKSAMSYLERLKARVSEKTSKILVTGDLNAGKSTFVNALLNESFLPTDQQPCTQSFCELALTKAITTPAVHAVENCSVYSSKKPETYSEIKIADMQEFIQSSENQYTWFKVFWPVSDNSRIKKYVVDACLDVSIIDSPGLNSDLFKTTSVLTKQPDIDVVVFVVNAANHLTLSAREFLERTVSEKDHIFFVINKMDEIMNSEKCRRIILEQIKSVSPKTWNEATELVHFISAKGFLSNIDQTWISSFLELETCLRSFIVENRTKSKLLPIYTYLGRLASDLLFILQNNIDRAESNLYKIQLDREMIDPFYDELVRANLPFRNSVQIITNEVCSLVYKSTIDDFYKLYEQAPEIICKVQWRGIINVFSYRKEVLEKIMNEVSRISVKCHETTLEIVKDGIDSIKRASMAHAGSLFSEWQNNFQDDIELSLVTGFEDHQSIPDLKWWDLIDFSNEIASVKTWLGTGLIGATLLTPRYVISFSSRFMDFFSVFKKHPLLVAILCIGGTLSMGLCVLDPHGLVHRRLEAHINDWIMERGSVQNMALRLESFARASMIARSGKLLVVFDDTLSTQRRLRLEKDIELKRLQEIRLHFASNRKRLERFVAELNKIILK